MFTQSRNFYENNIYQIQPKVVWKVVHGLMDMITRTKKKNITITKNKSLLFFSCSLSKQNPWISHPVIAAIFDVILNI